jgi:glycosyltransferase involved in cell wall biosynthesis
MPVVDVSVIIPTCHRETQLLETIASVQRQTGVELEIIVVDDSAGATARETVASVTDTRLQYMARPEPSRGRPAQVRNDGAQLARGRYLYFLDDDDLLQPDTLATMLQVLDAAPEAGMAFGVVEPFGPDAAALRHECGYFRSAARIARRLWGRWELSARLVFLPSILVNSACMARRSAYLAVGGYDTQIPICEDAEMWGRIAQTSGYVFVDRVVVRYRTGAPSLMRNLADGDSKLLTSYVRIQEKYRRAHGVCYFLLMKFWTRAVLRMADSMGSAQSRLAP